MLNRSSKVAPCSVTDLARAFGHPVAASIGDYTSELHWAYSDGKSLGDPNQLTKQIQQLVAKLLGVTRAAPREPGSAGSVWPAPEPVMAELHADIP